jgi:hypothetical protein
MSGGGLGPAGCWITHKGLETWARMAKERTTQKTQVGAVNSLSVLVRHKLFIILIGSDVAYGRAAMWRI